MEKTLLKLNREEKEKFKSNFLKTIGERLRIKRRKANLTQEELAACIEIDQASVSRYESGKGDITLSELALYSGYCDFPLSELFPKDESKELLSTIKMAVKVIVERNENKNKLSQSGSAIRIEDIGRVVQMSLYDGTYERKRTPIRERKKSMKSKYKDAEISTDCKPFTDDEFCAYIQQQRNQSLDEILSAGDFLRKVEHKSRKDNVEKSVANYVIDELIIRNIPGLSKKNAVGNGKSERVYAYYKKLYEREKSIRTQMSTRWY